MDPVTGQPGACLVVSRAATAIYLVLSASRLRRRQVLVPANLCYAAIFPILYAGYEPVFCDVDAASGNVACGHVLAALTPRTGAMIVPHMYGNPVGDMQEIARLCKERGILLIEDCASAMGARSSEYPLGAMGDYTLYSTGYSKTLDLGYGGLLVSQEKDLLDLEARERELPSLTAEAVQNLAFFSKMYRLMRNEGGDLPITKMIYAGLPECCRLGFVHRLDAVKRDFILCKLEDLDGVIAKRRDALNYYTHRLSGLSPELLYPYAPGAVPWRFNLLISDYETRQILIRECLRRKLPVSDWYPRVTPIFQSTKLFPGAEQHERQIVNFPLLADRDEIDSICELLLEYL